MIMEFTLTLKDRSSSMFFYFFIFNDTHSSLLLVL